MNVRYALVKQIRRRQRCYDWCSACVKSYVGAERTSLACSKVSKVKRALVSIAYRITLRGIAPLDRDLIVRDESRKV